MKERLQEELDFRLKDLESSSEARSLDIDFGKKLQL